MDIKMMMMSCVLINHQYELEGTSINLCALQGSMAYVSQQAWIQNMSLKSNILFAKQYHQKYYDRILDACALRQDIAILPGGDETEIGERVSAKESSHIVCFIFIFSNFD